MFVKTGLRILSVFIAMGLVLAMPLRAQQSGLVNDGVFATENAILDTSILFAIGAQEARQELRGAFGWPTYQEGLVEGVYFRFDPDGYARFAPTPRLDVDVFEVICRPRTHVCLARKDGLLLTLNTRGQIELQVEDVGASHSFSVAEGLNELPLPASILQQLDPRMELLLSAGGDFVVRRAEEEVQRISLKGFAAVVSYLRWVASRQDYLVLPRDWPVPNSGSIAQTQGVTQTTRWQSPMTSPNSISTQMLSQSDPVVESASMQSNGRNVAEMKDELKSLRNILERRENEGHPQAESSHAQDIMRLQLLLERLSAEVWALKNPNTIKGAPQINASDLDENAEKNEVPQGQSFAERLDYLITEIGLQPNVAILLLQKGTLPPEIAEEPSDPVAALLDELREKLPEEAEPDQTADQVSTQDYQLLTEYFRSVFPQDQYAPNSAQR